MRETGNGGGGALGAAAGAFAIVLFGAGAAILGDRPPMSASGTEVALDLAENRSRIQIGCAVSAVSMPLLVWFLATAHSVAGPARRATMVAYGLGLVFVALYLVDVAALAVGALRPESMAAAPELASALRDLEWVLPAIASPLGAGVLAAFALAALRDGAPWPPWVGRLAALAAAAYALRIGAIFTTDGPFAADGILGLWVPVLAVTAWFALGAVSLTVRIRRGQTPAS